VFTLLKIKKSKISYRIGVAIKTELCEALKTVTIIQGLTRPFEMLPMLTEKHLVLNTTNSG